jgi:hypothetical protein
LSRRQTRRRERVRRRSENANDRLRVQNRQRQHGDEDDEHRGEDKIDGFGGETGRGSLLRVWHSISFRK